MRGKEEDEFFKATYGTALHFTANLDRSKERSVEGIEANLNLGKGYAGCLEGCESGKEKDILDNAAKYYVAALNLAKDLGQASYVERATAFLKNIGRDEEGKVVNKNSDVISVSSIPTNSNF